MIVDLSHKLKYKLSISKNYENVMKCTEVLFMNLRLMLFLTFAKILLQVILTSYTTSTSTSRSLGKRATHIVKF